MFSDLCADLLACVWMFADSVASHCEVFSSLEASAGEFFAGVEDFV